MAQDRHGFVEMRCKADNAMIKGEMGQLYSKIMNKADMQVASVQ